MMKKRHLVLLGWALSSVTLFARHERSEEMVALVEEMSRSDELPKETLQNASDRYLEGYIQALVDMNYYEFKVRVKVEDRHVYLSHLPKNELMANSMLAYVKDIPEVKSVEVVKESSQEKKKENKEKRPPQVSGVWFPQSTVLFQPLVADPREPTNSVNLRGGDRVVGKRAIAVSIGDDFPIFRWRDVFRWHGDLQFGVQGCIWSVFNFKDMPHHERNCHESCELFNTDFFVGFPVTYAFDRWSFRLRGYHISSHLGDEFVCNRPPIIYCRRNPSYEAVDFFISYQFSGGVRAYIGPGVILHSDQSFPMKWGYIEWGMELRLFGHKFLYHKLYGTPFFAIHLENWQVRHWSLDQTFKLGYELSKLQGIGRKMRIYIDYHRGFSYEGQFFKERTQYGELGLSWGF